MTNVRRTDDKNQIFIVCLYLTMFFRAENLVFYSNIEVGEVLDKKLKREIPAKDFLANTKDVKEVRKIKTKISFDNFDFENQDIINKIGKKYQKLEIHIERT